MGKRMSLFFPPAKRLFPGQRWVKIALRTFHLIGMCGLGGGLFLPFPPSLLTPSMTLLVATGTAMVAVELWSNGVWLIQVRGLAIMMKIVLLMLIFVTKEWAEPLLLSIIVLSGVISHAPGDVRYYSLFHGRRIDSLR